MSQGRRKADFYFIIEHVASLRGKGKEEVEGIRER